MTEARAYKCDYVRNTGRLGGGEFVCRLNLGRKRSSAYALGCTPEMKEECVRLFSQAQVNSVRGGERSEDSARNHSLDAGRDTTSIFENNRFPDGD